MDIKVEVVEEALSDVVKGWHGPKFKESILEPGSWTMGMTVAVLPYHDNKMFMV